MNGPSPGVTEAASVGWLQERFLRRASRADVAALVALLALGVGAVVSGRHARETFKPRTAVETANVLDELEVPSRLPNAPLVDTAGQRVLLFDRIARPRGVVAFYASWCGPCQKELPKLFEQLGPHADVIVVTDGDEDQEATRRQLANLGLSEHGFLVDKEGQLEREAHVKALPTTYLISRQGAVLARTVGYSAMGMYRMKQKVRPRGSDVDAVDVEMGDDSDE